MSVRIINADVMDGLAQLPDESVHCVVTSPPYFGLRDYGTAQWDGGDPDCDHLNGRPGSDRADGIVKMVGHRNRDGAGAYSGDCRKCGATRIDKQIGLEPTPDAYVAKMVEVFREVRRVLRKDGTCWLNLGDSYNANQGKGFDTNQDGGERKRLAASPRVSSGGLAPKQLLGIPWRVAFALQADGWWLRQDIIWSKPNPMPESVTDRCTKAHEYIFLLTKAERYFYDAEAIKEALAGEPHAPGNRATGKIGSNTRTGGQLEPERVWAADGMRNKRSVWEVTTQPFPEAHFATFPPALIQPCVKAGCMEGGTVLDPFGGSGTTGLVADRLKRNAILIELNPEYAQMAERRVRGDCPMFAEVSI